MVPHRIDMRAPVALALLAALAMASACQRRPAQMRTRAGSAIGIETRHAAAGIARAIAERPDPACGTFALEGPFLLTTDWSLDGSLDTEPLLELNETRQLRQAADDALSYVREVDFRNRMERAGSRRREWRLIGDWLYSRDHNLPFERRQVDVTDRRRLTSSADEVFEVLVRATGDHWAEPQPTADGGWQMTASTTTPQGRRIRCGREADVDPWLTDLLTRTTVVQATARVWVDDEGRPRRRTGAWTLTSQGGDGVAEIVAAVDERLELAETLATVEVPANVVSNNRARLHRQLSQFLRALDEAVE